MHDLPSLSPTPGPVIPALSLPHAARWGAGRRAPPPTSCPRFCLDALRVGSPLDAGGQTLSPGIGQRLAERHFGCRSGADEQWRTWRVSSVVDAAAERVRSRMGNWCSSATGISLEKTNTTDPTGISLEKVECRTVTPASGRSDASCSTVGSAAAQRPRLIPFDGPGANSSTEQEEMLRDTLVLGRTEAAKQEQLAGQSVGVSSPRAIPPGHC